MTDELIVRREGVVTYLTLNRPGRANALSASLVDRLIDASLASFQDGTRLLVFDGRGKHFCAGFDFTGYEEQSNGDLVLRFIRIETLLQIIFHAPMETLALAHGSSFGAGADLVAACSHRIVAANATFRLPGLRFGLVLGTRRLCHRVGGNVAHEILATSRTFDAAEAMRIGFGTRLAEQGEWSALVELSAIDVQVLSREATANLNGATVPDTRASDMMDLAVSASAPGLGERIRGFREA